MKLKFYSFIALITFGTIHANFSFYTRKYTITNEGKKYTVHEITKEVGKLDDGTWVKLVCIKKGMIGLPNISMQSYRGNYLNKRQEKCYVFVLEPEGSIIYNDQPLKVYRSGRDSGILEDETRVRIECMAPGAVAKIAVTPDYRGTYYIEDTSGSADKRQQCHVYTINKKSNKVSLSGVGNSGFRSDQ